MNTLLKSLSIYVEKSRLFSKNAKLVLLHSAFAGLSFGVFRFLFNFYVLSLGPQYDEAFIGTLQTAASFASIAMALPAAYIAERFPPKRVMIATGWISTIAFLGLVISPMQISLIAFRMVAGISMSVRQVAVAPFLMTNTHEEERQWVFSFNFGLMTISGFFGNLLGGMLPTWLGGFFEAAPTDTLSYQLAIGSMMLVAILSIGPLAFIRDRDRDPHRKVPLPWELLWVHGRTLSKFLIPQLIIGLGAGLMQPFMNIYFRNVYGMPDPPISWVFAIGGLGMAVAQFVGPVLADKYGKIETVILTQLLSVPFLIMLGLGAWLVPGGVITASVFFLIAGVAYVFRLALMNLSNPVYQTFVLEQVPAEVQALAMSLNSLSFQFGWFIMPQVSGWLQVRFAEFGFVPIFGMVALFYVAATGIEWWIFKRPSAGQGDPIPVEKIAATEI